VGFTWDAVAGVTRTTTGPGSVKAANVRAAASGRARAALCQVDGRRWLTLEGEMTVVEDPAEVADAVRRYAERYRPPRPGVERVVLRLAVDRVMSSRDLR
jgi:hypothetical protein